jgi:hypothetical protein
MIWVSRGIKFCVMIIYCSNNVVMKMLENELSYGYVLVK